MAKKDWEKALEEYEHAIKLEPKCEASYLGKAEALRQLKRLPKAYSSLRAALEQLPGNAALKAMADEVHKEYQAGKEERQRRFQEELEAEQLARELAKGAGGCPSSGAAKDPRTEEEVKRQLEMWRGKTPLKAERDHLRDSLVETFLEQYERIGKAKSLNETATSQYQPTAKDELAIKGGHRPMPRPKDVALPKDFRKPVGIIPLEVLAKFNCKNSRLLISVFGDIFDVSDRPDKYGKDGPYSFFAGTDITWGLVSGKDTVENANRFYDVWKIAPEEARNSKLQGLCSWRAFYQNEYGEPVGRLEVFEREDELPPPPMEEVESCVLM